ncbi:hypothetical protein [Pseudomonas sp. NPDC007930]|uniref:hypothetical protein n=1 Tax=Pseudomonas sp. NPDC007930 TaxID=3364417 RepID=UPI0036EA58A4
MSRQEFETQLQKLRQEGAAVDALLQRRETFVGRYGVIPFAIGAGLAAVALYSMGVFKFV